MRVLIHTYSQKSALLSPDSNRTRWRSCRCLHHDRRPKQPRHRLPETHGRGTCSRFLRRESPESKRQAASRRHRGHQRRRVPQKHRTDAGGRTGQQKRADLPGYHYSKNRGGCARTHIYGLCACSCRVGLWHVKHIEWVRWVSEWVSEWLSEWVSEWLSEWVRWVSEWVSVWVSERKSASVIKSEWEWVRVSESESERWWVRVRENGREKVRVAVRVS